MQYTHLQMVLVKSYFQTILGELLHHMKLEIFLDTNVILRIFQPRSLSVYSLLPRQPITPLVDPVLVLLRNVLCVSSHFRILNLQSFSLVFPSVPKLLTYNRSQVILQIFFWKQNIFLCYFPNKWSEKELPTNKRNTAKVFFLNSYGFPVLQKTAFRINKVLQ